MQRFPASARSLSYAYSTTASSAPLPFRPVPILPNAQPSTFSAQALSISLPAVFPPDSFSLPARTKWFAVSPTSPHPRINNAYLADYADTLLPMELTTISTPGSANSPTPVAFARASAPLSLLLDYLSPATGREHLPSDPTGAASLYLAQCPIDLLPLALQADLPTPSLLSQPTKRDIYNTSLWLGLAPTSTPLHRDPNPNLFVQLAGTKTVRLYPPDVGAEIYAAAARPGRKGRVRGEEMMVGPERCALEDVVWGPRAVGGGWEAEVRAGMGVFVPLGWWHSVRGVGKGVIASVNWWFR